MIKLYLRLLHQEKNYEPNHYRLFISLIFKSKSIWTYKQIKPMFYTKMYLIYREDSQYTLEYFVECDDKFFIDFLYVDR